jgi:hypothetical protein
MQGAAGDLAKVIKKALGAQQLGKAFRCLVHGNEGLQHSTFAIKLDYGSPKVCSRVGHKPKVVKQVGAAEGTNLLMTCEPVGDFDCQAPESALRLSACLHGCRQLAYELRLIAPPLIDGSSKALNIARTAFLRVRHRLLQLPNVPPTHKHQGMGLPPHLPRSRTVYPPVGTP